MKVLLFIAGFVVLMATEIARVYYIMPFPGSQQGNTIGLAYFIQSNLGFIRLLGILLISYPLFVYFKTGTRRAKLVIGVLLLLYALIFYMFNYRFLADKMFIQPRHTVLVRASESKVSPKQLIVGVSLHGEARAYPIEIIGYHHQVRDTIGGENVMVTYCTVCRTGRVYEPAVDGKPETFRLVGMDHFNAMFEDSRTRSWWRQVNGEAIAGALKGHSLKEIPSEQMRLDAWIRRHPETLIMQPDSLFKHQYAGMKDYDEGKDRSQLTGRDTLSWKEKSWVIGVVSESNSKAFDWADLAKARVINDEIEGTPIVIAIESDTASFHAWKRDAGAGALTFVYSDSTKSLMDTNSRSVWDWNGQCVDGKLKGTILQPVQAYQEFWHSWRTFHPQTKQGKVSNN